MSDTRGQRLAALLEESARKHPGILLSVEAPMLDISWRGAAGVFNRDTGKALTQEAGFRIASMSKTFTGVLAAQLAERGELDPEAAAVDLLPADIGALMPVADGHDVGEITVSLLLHHRAGFNDFALSEAWFAELATDPGRFREPKEIASWALQNGTALGAPNTLYNYSDTGFVLAGLILESVTGIPYWQLCRERIFEPLAMNETWLEGHEAPRSSLSHCYLLMDGEHIDALQINGSCDWAAGGHVSTLEDLDRFLLGLFSGKLFTRPDTLDRFLCGREAKPGFYYGMGVGRKKIAGRHLWGHLGHWGSFMYFCPEARMRIAGTLNDDRETQNAFLESVLRAIAD